MDGFRPACPCCPRASPFTRFADEPEFGSLPNAGQPVVALNTMLAEDGAIHVVAGVDAGTVALLSTSPRKRAPLDRLPPAPLHPSSRAAA